MAISNEVGTLINAARAGIARADSINARQMVHNAEVHLRTAWSYIIATHDGQEAFEAAVRAIQTFGNEVAVGGSFAVLSEPAKAAQAEAITAVDRYSQAILDARPNSMAKAMGLDW